MSRIMTVGTIAALMLIMLSAPLQAQQTDPSEQSAVQSAAQAAKPASANKKVLTIAELEERSRQAYEEKNWVRYYGANIRMLNQRPFEPVYMQRIIAACSLLERLTTAFHYMLSMQQMGLAYDLSMDPDTENLRHTEVFTYINDQLIAAGEPIGTADAVFSLDEKFSAPSALAWDAGRDRFLLGSESDGLILAVAEDGSSEVLMQASVENGLWAIRGLHADVESNRLWVSTAAVAEFSAYPATDTGRSALVEFNLETLELLNRFNVPVDGAAHEFGPIAVTKAGVVYIIDRATSRVYRKPASGDGLEVFVGSDEMTALRGIAVTADNSRLYISDQYKGILVIDPRQQASAILTGPENTNFGGIVSMSYDLGKLFVIQSGHQPERVVQFGLDTTGSNVLSRLPVASALAEFDHPGLSLVKDERVYYFANLGDADGSGARGPTLLMRSPMPVENEIPAMNKSDSDEPQDSK